MAINLYSKDSVDTLLAAKLSDAPSDGSTYGRKDGAWEVVSGGGGGAVWGSISGTLSSQSDLASALGAKADVTGASAISVSGSSGTATLGSADGSSITVSDVSATSTTSITPAGITFPDSTTQTTAAVAPPSADTLTANAIGANIAGISGSSGYWVGNSSPSVAGLVTWGIYNPSDGYVAYYYSSGFNFYLYGNVTTSGSTVQISGSNSSFYVY
jgi:hypothetical protein